MTLTLDIIQKARRELPHLLPGGLLIQVWDFKIQFRTPRTRKRRIRRKWAKQSTNWRALTGQAYRSGNTIVCGPDVFTELQREIHRQDPLINSLLTAPFRASQPTIHRTA